ncbi:MAG: BatD family protein [Gemmatimonadales bacterium]|nr:BatD family protein [Gemmatimonadales bacterium]
MIGLLVLTLLQAPAPELEASVDLDRISVGEEIVYTVRAVSRSSEPMSLAVALLNGFETVARSERTEVSYSGGPTRTTLLEIRLRALRPGRWQVGPARVTQGREVTEASAIAVHVEPNANVAATTLNPRLRSLLERTPPPPRGKAAVALIVSADSVRVGEQVDVVTAAWFPRDLRLQLRRPPTLQPPVIDGVWSYPQAAPSGIAVTREIGGIAYDLFVAHQVVFPLLPGTIAIPRAMLKYSTPLALQFFSQEERFALTSLPGTLAVRALPGEGRPGGFDGAVGSALRLERRVSPSTARRGEGVTVELIISGVGNTALWPPPKVRWPGTARAYSDRIDEQVATVQGRIGGVKTFSYLVVPDSVGPLTLPAVNYSYYDLAARAYRSTSVGVASVPVAEGGESATAAALPPALLTGSDPALSWRLARQLPDWVWAAVLLVPPLAVFGRTWRPRRRARRVLPEASGLREAEAKLDAVVRGLVPNLDQRSRAGLAAAVRAAGADADTAWRLAAAREQLLSRRYGPGESSGDDPALVEEVHELISRLGASLRGWRGRGAVTGILLGLTAGGLAAQSPSPERLYEIGALRAAAEGFARRAELEPAVAAHWYDLGASYYRLGLKGRAAAAWQRARRLDPREPTIRRALRLTPPPDATSARWTWSPPVTSEELLLLGALGWLAGWIGWVARPRLRDRWAILLGFAAASTAAGFGIRAWHRRPVGIVLDQTTLRISPHGLAPALGPLDPGGAVEILRGQSGWTLVRASGSREGWVASNAIAAIGG